MGHTYTSLLTHVVFSTKERFPMLDAEIRDEVEKYICGVARNLKVTVLAINSVADHLHTLVEIPPVLSVAEVVGKLKSNSSRFVHEKWPARSKFGWQQGYGGFSVSRSGVDEVVRYIGNQEEHHRNRSFKEEFLEFLRKYEIEYDEKYLWW